MTPDVTARSALRLPAPAKLNLFLHVIGRREDGKHLLQSIFTLVSLADEIDLVVRSDDRIVRTGDLLCCAEDDLCTRAARALKTAAGRPELGANISVQKRIPAGAGLGGGSSDAATTLIGLNRLWELDFSRAELMKIGETLGADVPFFIWGRSGFVEGIGERISSFEIPQAEYEILWPGKGVSTAEIFRSPNLTRNTESLKMSVFSKSIQDNWPDLPGRNDLQPVAENVEPLIAQALEALKRLGLRPRMTGSGSAVFAVTGRQEPALGDLPSNWRHFRVRSLHEHPLCGWMN